MEKLRVFLIKASSVYMLQQPAQLKKILSPQKMIINLVDLSNKHDTLYIKIHKEFH